MNKQITVEGNHLIAEFIGRYKKGEDITKCEDRITTYLKYDWAGNEKRKTRAFTYADLQYHTSWDWLIPVIIKIKNFQWDNDNYRNHVLELDSSVIDEYDISQAYDAVVNAVKFCNDQFYTRERPLAPKIPL